MKSTHWPLISFKWHSLANLKKQKPCVVLPLLSRMNIEQVVGTTSKLFQSRLVICLLQFWIFSFSGNMHQKQKVLSLQRLSQDLGFGFVVQNLFYVFFLHVLHWRADPACYMEDHSSVLPAWLPWWPKVFSWHRAWWGTFYFTSRPGEAVRPHPALLHWWETREKLQTVTSGLISHLLFLSSCIRSNYLYMTLHTRLWLCIFSWPAVVFPHKVVA